MNVITNIDQKVREQLVLSRQLLAAPANQLPGVRGPLCILRDLIVAYGATELALAAICVQLDCLPRKKYSGLPDYFDSLTRATHASSIVPGMNYLAELHKVRFDAHRFRQPDPERWMRARELTLEYVSGWCMEFLGVSLFDIDLAPPASGEDSGAATQTTAPPRRPGSVLEPITPRYNCDGSADIRLSHRGLPERGRIANLSIGGCYVNSDLNPQIGDQLEMMLQVNRTSFRVAGSVVHIPMVDVAAGRRESSGMGVQFNGMSIGARIRLEELIAELKINRML